MFSSSLSVLFALFFTAVLVRGESHTIHFNNRCGRGTPRLIRAGQTLSTGQDYTINGPLIGAIAYLQTGNCLLNGEHCITVETTLVNPDPARPGSGSSTDLSLIPPLAFSVTTGFQYSNGCNGGATCNNANCNTAFHVPSDTHVQVACQQNNANLIINFC